MSFIFYRCVYLVLWCLITLSAEPTLREDFLCGGRIDVVAVLDITFSTDVWKPMASKMRSALEKVLSSGADVRFGLTTFSDKNIRGQETVLGYEGDYCLNVDIPLDTVRPWEFMKYLSKKAEAGGGGADWKENPLEALIRTLYSRNVQWSRLARTLRGRKRRVQRLLVLVVDSAPHIAGDVTRLTGLSVRPFDISKSMLEKGGDDVDCNAVDYPSFADAAAALRNENAGAYDNGEFVTYSSVVQFGDQYSGTEDNMFRLYRDYFMRNGIDRVFGGVIRGDMSDFAEVFRTSFIEFNKWRCEV